VFEFFATAAWTITRTFSNNAFLAGSDRAKKREANFFTGEKMDFSRQLPSHEPVASPRRCTVPHHRLRGANRNDLAVHEINFQIDRPRNEIEVNRKHQTGAARIGPRAIVRTKPIRVPARRATPSKRFQTESRQNARWLFSDSDAGGSSTRKPSARSASRRSSRHRRLKKSRRRRKSSRRQHRRVNPSY